ncbi:hypothetical protein [Streptomyces violaceusniger]|uniref:Uncharacterized protein n=1 Tax=Streptomyces violaceusniger (strain Tu 4113) TaxID=653045 RepID=G2P874_STRV4|nr:hypothetical protein [Streptomyces violaceusniger]AEM85875.1 hypothetical protein Strvi_6443 [Streptomyces violaceusniger Tu 4113]
MSDTFRSKHALKLCVVCRQPVGKKKRVFATGGQPVHRTRQSPTDRSATRSAAPPGLIRAPKDISRAKLLKRIEALRKLNAKMKPGAAKAQSADRPKPPTALHLGKRPNPSPQPYYGVDMKFTDGRWVQMHPDSE